MKVGLLSFQRSLNYGAFFQCLGLQNALRALGHEVEVIDYHPPHRRDKANLRFSRRRLWFHRVNLLRVRQLKFFDDALRNELLLASTRCTGLDELAAQAARYEALVCGSDQIWNAEHTGGALDPAYFGAFGTPQLRRVAYAPSFGGATLDAEHHAAFCALAAGMDVVSVRELSGAAFAARMLGRPVSQMPDPCLLWPGFEEMARPPAIEPGYLMSYRMQPSPLFDAALRAAAAGRQLIHVDDGWPLALPGRSVLPDPAQWLGLIRGSGTLVTNSFHGVVFALLFERPFVAVPRAGAYAGRTERISSFLDCFGLRTLLCEREQDVGSALAAAGQVDWDRVRRVREQERARGLVFLAEALRD
ncbi:polysaccharide pyruvyl transferase family protein [Rivibacter subsaxonicus]|uniref:Polysaccharide pyruvyl transferase n=1 Tax=Rivibacter subsaxonicus TaxID=457575 RepID=A0A4V2FU97_9BURK|nr:polysaccharide pyruvyl transferase family protein [Rivibacter subsaxonicus]RZU01196.1 polysaccharide pyruvyl transferase [Rivibacter subsaxonicus]